MSGVEMYGWALVMILATGITVLVLALIAAAVFGVIRDIKDDTL